MFNNQDEEELLLTDLFSSPSKQHSFDYIRFRNQENYLRNYSKFDEAINHFIKTSQYDNDERWYKDESEVGHGFYLIDYGKYLSILNQFKTKDEKFRKQKIDELQKKIPILYKSKKFKRTILNELENRILLNPDLMKEARTKLEDSSFFIKLLEMDEYRDFNEKCTASAIPDNSFYFRANFYLQYSSKNEVDKFIFVISSMDSFQKNNQYFEKILKIIDEGKDIEELGKIKIDSKKMIVFHNNSFQTVKPQDYEEKFIECNNGTFSINKYSDSNYKENINKIKLFQEALVKKKWTFDDYVHSSKRDPHGTRLDKLHERQNKLFHDKYKIEKPGLCFYYIKYV